VGYFAIRGGILAAWQICFQGEKAASPQQQQTFSNPFDHQHSKAPIHAITNAANLLQSI